MISRKFLLYYYSTGTKGVEYDLNEWQESSSGEEARQFSIAIFFV